ncbi:hypothetical protein NHX12_013016, partial [Muraenolepis orangiensis]
MKEVEQPLAEHRPNHEYQESLSDPESSSDDPSDALSEESGNSDPDEQPSNGSVKTDNSTTQPLDLNNGEPEESPDEQPSNGSVKTDNSTTQPLDLNNGEPEERECMDWSDMKKPAPLNVLLTNLIKGNLLSGAHLWITARPASSRNIPAEYIDLVTEVRGFNDLQREQYFRKRYRPELAERILTHIKKSRALYIMCYIP